MRIFCCHAARRNHADDDSSELTCIYEPRQFFFVTKYHEIVLFLGDDLLLQKRNVWCRDENKIVCCLVNAVRYDFETPAWLLKHRFVGSTAYIMFGAKLQISCLSRSRFALKVECEMTPVEKSRLFEIFESGSCTNCKI